ncbi:hypothetical protein ORI89_18820 [Sphingobacterium sp. UT-1RO-CII-1]|uniref:hypothetical protein n=1 Tax=Sphingobacterium sp. UT-1RO-CII-1 TaxID=2995225 RepID=UPI00227BD343|nr:hypothetical protein [Sphingobacterium sp. UT-1RO-CII-1]MCY4781711.1 hypothetical protein [Sphingobacterium sp. UT-1RO-CII-1]
MAGIAGKLLRVKLGDKYIKCQADATATFTNTAVEEEDCKPDGSTLVTGGSWVNRDEAESQDWSLSVSSRVFLDALDGASVTQADLIAANIAGNLNFDVEFLTTPGQHNGENDLLISGNMFLSSISLNAVLTGKATTDIEFLGNGKPTQTVIPTA